MWAFRGRGGIPAATHAPLRLSTASTPWSPHSARAHATSRSVTNAHTHSAAPASSSRACSSTSRSSSADQHAGRAEGQNQPGRHPPRDAAPHEGAQARCVDPDREPRHRGGQLQEEQQPTPEAHADERDDEGREATALIEDAGQAPQEDRLTTISTTTSFSCKAVHGLAPLDDALAHGFGELALRVHLADEHPCPRPGSSRWRARAAAARARSTARRWSTAAAARPHHWGWAAFATA